MESEPAMTEKGALEKLISDMERAAYLRGREAARKDAIAAFESVMASAAEKFTELLSNWHDTPTEEHHEGPFAGGYETSIGLRYDPRTRRFFQPMGMEQYNRQT